MWQKSIGRSSPASAPREVENKRSALDDSHIFRMTDETGIFQHAKYSVPDPAHGYTTDDNARALLVAAMLWERFGFPEYLDLAYIYLRFVLGAKNGDGFRNFMDYNRQFPEATGSEDCFGRVIWSLGYVVSSSLLPRGLRQTAGFLLQEISGRSERLQSVRGKAFSLLGLSLWGGADPRLIRKLAGDLVRLYQQNTGEGWRWFEEKLTYGNALIPLSLLEAFGRAPERKWLETGLASLDFLLETTIREGVFQPVGCKGWYERGKEIAVYDQQPVEAGETVLACVKAYRLTKERRYLEAAKTSYDWFLGKNIAGVSLIDPDTGGCMDGITPDGPNRNEGAESLISWFLAWLVWDEVRSEALYPVTKRVTKLYSV